MKDADLGPVAAGIEDGFVHIAFICTNVQISRNDEYHSTTMISQVQ